MIDVRLSDGTVLRFPDGMSKEQMKAAIDRHLGNDAAPQTREERVAAARANMTPQRAAEQANIDLNTEDRMVLDSNGGVLGGIAVKGAQGLPFIGSYVDELAEKVNGPGAGERGVRIQQAMDRQYPKTAIGAQMAGTVAGAIPMAMAAGPSLAARAPASRTGQVIGGGILGAISGGTEGAIYGYGEAEGKGRMGNAQDQAAIGAAFGGVAGGLMPLASNMIEGLIKRYKGSDVKAIAKEFGVSNDTAKVLKMAFENNDQSAVDRILRAGSEATMGDAGRAGAALTDAAAQQGGRPLNIVDSAVTARANRSLPKVNSALDDALGPVRGPRQASREIAQASAPARSSAYNAAYGTPIDYGTGGAGEGVLRALDIIPPGKVKKAVDLANQELALAVYRGDVPPDFGRQILVEVGDNGKVAFKGELPNVAQLDALKKSLDALGESTEPLGRVSSEGRLARGQAQAVRDATVEATGGAQGTYASALKIGGDKIQEDKALEFGLKMLRDSDKTTKEVAQEMLQGMSTDGRKMMKAGVRAHLDDVMGRVKSIASDTDADAAREAMRGLKELSSPNARAKLKLLLGKAEFDRLIPQLDEALMSQGMRADVARNSATAIRGNIKGAVDDVTAPGVLGRAERGEPIEGTKALVQFLLNTTPATDAARKEQIWSEIAEVLTKKRGNRSAEAALKYVEKAISGQPLTEQQAKLVANQVGGFIPLVSGPTARQFLLPQQ